jgi:hypothetical protein
MTNKIVSRLTGLSLILASTLTAAGWIPFTAPVTIETDPDGAEVFAAGGETPLGVTPFNTRVFMGEKRLEVRMDKFYTEEVVLNQDTPETVALTLRPTPVLVYTKPAAALYAEDSSTPLSTDGRTAVSVSLEDKNYVLKAKDYFDKKITIGLGTDSPQVIELEHRPLIKLTAAQSGVDIYENGSFLAKAPVTEEILKPRTFEFRKEGFYKKSVDLTPAQTHAKAYQMQVSLEPLPVITIKATPSSADIYMVGKSEKIGTGSAELMIEKETAFEIKADRYYPETFTVDARTQTAAKTLKAMPYVMIKSSPAGAAVALNGKSIGTTPVEQLIEKSVSVELTKEGYISKTVTLDGRDLSPMIALEAKPVAPPTPTVTIDSTPTGASVSIDGKVVGTTPVEQAVKAPITVTVSKEGYLPQTVTLDGSDLKPTVTLQEEKKSFWQKLFGK